MSIKKPLEQKKNYWWTLGPTNKEERAQIKRIRNEHRNIATNTKEIQNNIREFCWNIHSVKLNKLKETNAKTSLNLIILLPPLPSTNPKGMCHAWNIYYGCWIGVLRETVSVAECPGPHCRHGGASFCHSGSRAVTSDLAYCHEEWTMKPSLRRVVRLSTAQRLVWKLFDNLWEVCLIAWGLSVLVSFPKKKRHRSRSGLLWVKTCEPKSQSCTWPLFLHTGDQTSIFTHRACFKRI